MRACEHWRAEPGLLAGGRCMLGRYGGTPAYSICSRVCDIPAPSARAWADRARREQAPEDLPDGWEIAKGFAAAMRRWRAAGYKTVPRRRYRERLRICNGCPHWRGLSRLGFGTCRRCGCGRLKHWLATESCPLGRW